MGKGEIISGGDGGKYQVKIILHRERVIKAIAALEEQMAALEERIAGMEEGTEKDTLMLQKTALWKKKQYYETNTPQDPTIEAWCADLTEDLTGFVGTMEINGERKAGVNIQPGFEGNAEYNPQRDGMLQPAIAATPAGAFYNLAMFPGWQKWKPTFRYGTITFLDGDTCTVDLDPAVSSCQGLNINQTNILQDVPIDYMECNGSAFEEGDKVIVKFQDQDWTKPKVIGFRDNPKSCLEEFYLKIKIDNKDLFYGGQYFRIKYTNKSGWESVTEERRVYCDKERDAHGYTMGLCGPFEFKNEYGEFDLDKTKSIYIGLKREREMDAAKSVLVDDESPDCPFDWAGYTDLRRWHGQIEETLSRHYIGLDYMFAYLWENNYGLHKVYTKDYYDTEDEMYYVEEGMTQEDSIPNGEVLPTKYWLIDWFYAEKQWSDFQFQKEEHITPSSYPDTQEIMVAAFNLNLNLGICRGDWSRDGAVSSYHWTNRLADAKAGYPFADTCGEFSSYPDTEFSGVNGEPKLLITNDKTPPALANRNASVSWTAETEEGQKTGAMVGTAEATPVYWY